MNYSIKKKVDIAITKKNKKKQNKQTNSNHSFQSVSSLKIMVSCIELHKRVEIHTFTFRQY